jgi:hypothetical protein
MPQVDESNRRQWRFPCPTHLVQLISQPSLKIVLNISLAQMADLREYAQAFQLGEGTIHLERSVRKRERRRAELFSLFEQDAFVALLQGG